MASVMTATHPTTKPTPRQPKTFDSISFRCSASTFANFALHEPRPRVQLPSELTRGSTAQNDLVIGKMKQTSVAMRNQ